jgi:hypothetical protein
MAFACENISTDPVGRVTFANVTDVLTAAAFPTITAQLFVVFGFVGKIAGFIVKPRIVIEDEGGAKVAEAILKDLAMTSDVPIARAVVGFQGIQWQHPGQHIVKFLANGDKVIATFPLSLVLAHIPGVSGAPGGP